MIKLLNILHESILESEELDLSPLNDLDDLIAKELETASKQENEVLLTAVSLALAVPGILNSIAQVIGVITKKSGLDLRKRDPAWYKVLEQVTAKIDGYLDKPFLLMLKPFVQNEETRHKIAKVLKAVTLASMAIAGQVDVNSIKDTASSIKNLAGDTSSEILQAIAEQSSSKLAAVLKAYFKNIK